MTETTPTECDSTMVDAVRSIASALNKDITCDKAKGYLLLLGASVLLIVVFKFFVAKR